MIFVDSSFLVSFYNTNDSQHKKALKVFNSFGNNLFDELILSNFIFLECLTVVSQRVSKKAARDLGDYLIKDPVFKIVHIDEYLQQETWEIFKKIKRKNMSFVDCSILAIIKEEGIEKLLTFDTTDFKSFQKEYDFTIVQVS